MSGDITREMCATARMAGYTYDCRINVFFVDRCGYPPKELLALCQLEGDLDFGVLDGCEEEMLRKVGASSMAGRKLLSGGGEIAALMTPPPTSAR